MTLKTERGSIQNTTSPTPKRAAAIKRTAIVFLLTHAGREIYSASHFLSTSYTHTQSV